MPVFPSSPPPVIQNNTWLHGFPSRHPSSYPSQPSLQTYPKVPQSFRHPSRLFDIPPSLPHSIIRRNDGHDTLHHHPRSHHHYSYSPPPSTSNQARTYQKTHAAAHPPAIPQPNPSSPPRTPRQYKANTSAPSSRDHIPPHPKPTTSPPSSTPHKTAHSPRYPPDSTAIRASPAPPITYHSPTHPPPRTTPRRAARTRPSLYANTVETRLNNPHRSSAPGAGCSNCNPNRHPCPAGVDHPPEKGRNPLRVGENSP
mmetsp:Transcript_56402/g.67598  ORF Transcript_56402/g.67598 Transcript_56402/m.67598 type:complete len:255 (+) Transcript_56402:165-929(+)